MQSRSETSMDGSGGRCLTCRARRLRCDGTLPHCQRCLEGGFHCIRSEGDGFADSDAISSAQGSQSISWIPKAYASSTTSDRAALACATCRARKIRCSGPVDGDTSSCSRCERLNLECNWIPNRQHKRRRVRQDPEAVPSPTATHMEPRRARYLDEGEERSRPKSIDTMLGDQAELTQHVKNYFASCHYFGFLTFIHEPSFYKLLAKGQAPGCLTSMMVVCSLHFCSGASTHSLARAQTVYEPVYRSIQAKVFQSFDAISLMTLLLARFYEGARGNFIASWTMCGIAVRMMQFLSLHTLHESYQSKDFLSRLNPLLSPEALRRLAWAVFYLDTMADAGQHGSHLLTEAAFRIQLPCNETTFLKGEEVMTANLHATALRPQPASSPSNEGPTAVGISGHLIRTAAMRRRVLHFYSLIPFSQDSKVKILSDLDTYEARLKTMIGDLPETLVYTDNNLFVHAKMLPSFLMLHLLRHNCFLMLAMARLRVCEGVPDLQDTAGIVRCERIRHALAVSSIIQDATRLGVNCGPAAGVQAYSSLEVLVFDPRHLSVGQGHAADMHKSALHPLLEYIRTQSQVDERNRLLHIEACGRLARAGLHDLLTPMDWTKCTRDGQLSAQEDTEFNFQALPFHRRVTGKGDHALWDAEVYDKATSSSRAGSPTKVSLDAGVVAGPSNMTMPFNPVDDTISATLHGLADPMLNDPLPMNTTTASRACIDSGAAVAGLSQPPLELWQATNIAEFDWSSWCETIAPGESIGPDPLGWLNV